MGPGHLRRFAPAIAACACAGAVLVPATQASARGGDDRVEIRSDRVEVRVKGVCGRRSSARLRLRARDGRIRADLRVNTAKRGLWRVGVFHERRLVKRVRVRATRSRRGFEYRVFLPDFDGPDAVWIRAAAPRGETCSAGATVVEP